jgi:hypothetical protein
MELIEKAEFRALAPEDALFGGLSVSLDVKMLKGTLCEPVTETEGTTEQLKIFEKGAMGWTAIGLIFFFSLTTLSISSSGCFERTCAM